MGRFETCRCLERQYGCDTFQRVSASRVQFLPRDWVNLYLRKEVPGSRATRTVLSMRELSWGPCERAQTTPPRCFYPSMGRRTSTSGFEASGSARLRSVSLCPGRCFKHSLMLTTESSTSCNQRTHAYSRAAAAARSPDDRSVSKRDDVRSAISAIHRYRSGVTTIELDQTDPPSGVKERARGALAR